MKISVSLGSSPWGEDCAQVGQSDYEDRGLKECTAYKTQLLQHYAANFGLPLPEGATLKVQACPHDFGTYFEVHGEFDDSNAPAGDAIMWLESNSPEFWDDPARAALEITEVA